MSIKLLPASVNTVEAPSATEVSASLVAGTPRAIASRPNQAIPIPAADVFTWSFSTRRGEPKFIHGTLVEDSQSDEAGPSTWEYVSGWAWGRLVESTAIAHYLTYASAPAKWGGQLINLYA
jgi:hypothetical protein